MLNFMGVLQRIFQDGRRQNPGRTRQRKKNVCVDIFCTFPFRLQSQCHYPQGDATQAAADDI
ncbi:hypothetical protein DW219_08345 [Desulfovibrio sp. AM18-2]|nr:hypothetical protein DW219_08345 [Desulfovibrio sp. AM18-2]